MHIVHTVVCRCAGVLSDSGYYRALRLQFGQLCWYGEKMFFVFLVASDTRFRPDLVWILLRPEAFHRRHGFLWDSIIGTCLRPVGIRARVSDRVFVHRLLCLYREQHDSSSSGLRSDSYHRVGVLVPSLLQPARKFPVRDLVVHNHEPKFLPA